jgi:hypothetical protein
LVRLESPQLTVHGFGYAIAGGTFSNPFFANFLQPPEYLEFFSAPPLTPGVTGPEDSELPIRFSATLAPVPQTGTWALLLTGFGMLGLATLCRRHSPPLEQAALPRREDIKTVVDEVLKEPARSL